MTEKLQASVNVVRKPVITVDMLVQDIQGNNLLVVKVTNKWVHCVVLTRAAHAEFEGNYHGIILHKRMSLTPLVAGSRFQINQKAH